MGHTKGRAPPRLVTMTAPQWIDPPLPQAPPVPPEQLEAGVRRRADYGLSFLVALGFYASVVGAFVVGAVSLPVAPQSEDCAGFCFSPALTMVVFLVFAVPYAIGLLLLTLVILVPVVRLTRSPLLAGAVSGGAGLAITGMVVLSIVGSR
jgi:hypothetical protein